MRLTDKKGVYVALLIPAMLFTGPLAAEVYKWIDKDGNVHFSDKQSAPRHAKPVQLSPSLNSYQSRALPASTPSPKVSAKQVNRSRQLPKLRPRQVILYSTVWCGFCKKAKAYFKQKGIAYTERDIEKSAQAKQEYQSLGGGGVPLILVGNKNGTRKLSGFSVARFDTAYH